MSEIVLTKQHKTAIELNQKILITAQAAQQNLYDMCVMLKQMRDDKLYKELGYNDFGDYCENEIGIKRSHVYNHIATIEKVKNVQSIGQIGITKLSLLASLSESQQEQIQQTVNLEDTSVRELKAEIARLKADKDTSETNLRALKTELAEANEKINELESRPVEVKFLEDAGSKETIRQLEDELDNARERIEELESRPVEVAVHEDTMSKETIRQLESQITDLEEQLEQANSKPAAVLSVSNDKESFKAYYLSAVNAFENMLEFVSGCNEKDICISKITALLTRCTEMMEEII